MGMLEPIENAEPSEDGLIYYRLQIQLKCPHCQNIFDLDGYTGHQDLDLISQFVEDDVLDKLMMSHSGGTIGLAYEHDLIEYECDSCGESATYRLAKTLNWPDQYVDDDDEIHQEGVDL